MPCPGRSNANRARGCHRVSLEDHVRGDRKRRELADLEHRLASASGSERSIDRLVADLFDDRPAAETIPNYTGSVDACLALIGRVLPHWHWHVGYGPGGVLPYAALRIESAGAASAANRVEATAPTVPLALLGALIKAKQGGRRRR